MLPVFGKDIRGVAVLCAFTNVKIQSLKTEDHVSSKSSMPHGQKIGLIAMQNVKAIFDKRAISCPRSLYQGGQRITELDPKASFLAEGHASFSRRVGSGVVAANSLLRSSAFTEQLQQKIDGMEKLGMVRNPCKQ